MTKGELINEVLDDEYKRICKTILPPYADDLYQELCTTILEYDDGKLAAIPADRRRFFLVGILCRMAKSSTSPFYRKYRKPYIPLEEYEGEEETQEQIEAARAYEKLPEFNKRITDLYHEHGSFRKVQKKTGINYGLVHKVYNETLEKIRSKMTKVNVLLMTQLDDNALKYHRQITPHARLIKTHPEIRVTEFKGGVADDGKNFESDIDLLSDEQLKQFQVIYFLRRIGYRPDQTQKVVDRLHGLGIKVVVDIDDYWKVPAAHHLFEQYKRGDIVKHHIDSITLADHVITTTTYFADEIRKYNTNVTVLPNCISPDDIQFKARTIPSERVRIGWVGGVYHRADIQSIENTFCKLKDDKDIRDKYQLCLGGYNVTRTDTQIHIPKDYHHIEVSMTCNYHFRDFDANYMEYLYSFTPTMEHVGYDKEYRRIWSRDINNYGGIYNEMDVATAPLVDSKFNRCKSELKIVEAGWMGKAVIVQDMEPYAPWINGKNGIKVKHSRNGIDWYLAMKKLITERAMREDMAAALHETITTHFDMDKHNETRAGLYKSLV